MTPTSQDQPKVRFWRRQFLPEATIAQLAFDAFFGAIAPIGCLVFDPIVFQSHGVLHDLRMPAYIFIGASIAVLLLWLSVRRQLPQYVASLVGGALFAGGCIALVIGLLLLPLSVIALTLGIGVLGFTPFATAFAFFRNSRRASRQAQQPTWSASRQQLAWVGAILILAAPVVIDRSLTMIGWNHSLGIR